FLFAIAEGTIEPIVGFRFMPIFLGPSFRLIAGRLGHRALNGHRVRWLDANLRLRRDGWPQLRAVRALDDVAFHLGFERAWPRPRGADRARGLRFTLGRLWSRFAQFCGCRVRVEDVAASRALKGRRIVGQDPLVNPVAGVATGALNFYHSP